MLSSREFHHLSDPSAILLFTVGTGQTQALAETNRKYTQRTNKSKRNISLKLLCSLISFSNVSTKQKLVRRMLICASRAP
jgi:hypothetical protein